MAIKYHRITAPDALNHGWTGVMWDGHTMGYVRKVEPAGGWDAKSAGDQHPPMWFRTRQRATAWLMTGATWAPDIEPSEQPVQTMSDEPKMSDGERELIDELGQKIVAFSSDPVDRMSILSSLVFEVMQVTEVGDKAATIDFFAATLKDAIAKLH